MNDEPPDEYGEQPPHDLVAEQCILGSCLVPESRAFDDIADQISAGDFYRPAHGDLWALLADLRGQGREIDAVTVFHELQNRGLLKRGLDAPYLHTCIAAVPSTANVGYYVEIVRMHALRRRLVESSVRIAQLARAQAEDPAELVERARASLDAVAVDARGGIAPSEFHDLFDAALARYASEAPPALPLGFPELDDMLGGGLRPGQMVCVAGRPGTGKSLIAACAAVNVAENGGGALIASLEMSEAELMDRIVANLSGVDHGRLTRHALTRWDWERVRAANERRRALPIAIEDNPYLNVTAIRSVARDRARTARGLALLVVDYLNLVRPADERKDRREQVDAISRGIKLLGKELGVPVLALAQLNRMSEMRAGRRPQLSDLRESGALEQDSDIVLLLHHDDTDDEHRFDLEVIVAKNRGGRTGSVFLPWSPELSRIGVARLQSA